jgi:hypothetical protein
MRSLFLLFLGCLLFSLTGCVVAQRGTTQVKWEPGDKDARVIPALETGRYALLKGSDYKPQYVVFVNRGDNIGFQKIGGQLYAVYGQKQDQLSDANARYYWNYCGR